MKKILSYLAKNHQRVANLASLFSAFVAIPATIIGVWFTYHSIDSSSEMVEKQLIEQKRATSVSVVGDFLTVLTDKISDTDEVEMEKFKKVIVTRTQLLIDNLDFPELIAQIIEFLGDNDLSELFNSESGSNKKYIELSDIELSSTKLSGLTLENPSIRCSNFENTTIQNAEFMGSIFVLSNLKSSQLYQSKLDESYVFWANFQNSYIYNTSFSNATIHFSNMRGIKHIKNPDSNREEIVDAITNTLMKAKSLYGSQFDDDVKESLLSKKRGEYLLSVNSSVSGIKTALAEKQKKFN